LPTAISFRAPTPGLRIAVGPPQADSYHRINLPVGADAVGDRIAEPWVSVA